MGRTMSVMAVLLLAGCSTPEQLMNAKEASSYTSDQAPKVVANCIARNQVQSGGLGPTITDGPHDTVELTFLDRNYNITQVYVVIAAAASGSDIKMWTASPYLRQTIENGLMKGC
jgi:hypothetical protein